MTNNSLEMEKELDFLFIAKLPPSAYKVFLILKLKGGFILGETSLIRKGLTRGQVRKGLRHLISIGLARKESIKGKRAIISLTNASTSKGWLCNEPSQVELATLTTNLLKVGSEHSQTSWSSYGTNLFKVGSYINQPPTNSKDEVPPQEFEGLVVNSPSVVSTIQNQNLLSLSFDFSYSKNEYKKSQESCVFSANPFLFLSVMIYNFSINSTKNQCEFCNESLEEKNSLVKKRNKKFDEIAQRAIEHLNKKAGRKFPSQGDRGKANRNMVIALLKRGNSEEDVMGVIDIMCEERAADPEWAKYLRPSTLFGSKFETSYVGMVGATPHKQKTAEEMCAEYDEELRKRGEL